MKLRLSTDYAISYKDGIEILIPTLSPIYFEAEEIENDIDLLLGRICEHLVTVKGMHDGLERLTRRETT